MELDKFLSETINNISKGIIDSNANIAIKTGRNNVDFNFSILIDSNGRVTDKDNSYETQRINFTIPISFDKDENS